MPDVAPTQPPGRVGWHIAGSIAAWALPLATSLAAMPFLWRTLGADGYGVYILAAGYAALAGSLGSMRGAAQRVSAGASSGAALQAALGGAYLAAAGTGLATLAAAFMLAPVFLRMAGIDPEAAPSILNAFRLAGAAAPAIHLAQAARGILIGLERYGLYSAHVTATTVLTTVGMVLLAASGARAPELMAWLVMASVASAAAAVALAQTTSGVRPTGAWSDGRAIVQFGATVVATETLLTLYVLVERTVLTRAMGVGAVAEYTIPMTVASSLQNAMAAGAVVLLPRAGAAWARGDTAALRSMYSRAVKVIILLAVGGSTIIAGGAETLVGWWIDPDFARQTAGVIAVLLAVFAVNAAATPIWCLAEGAGRPARNTALGLAMAITGIGASVILAPMYGAHGIAWARCLAVLAIPVFVWLGERSVLGRVQGAVWSAVAISVVPAGLVLVAAVAMATYALTGVPLLVALALFFVAYVARLWRSKYFGDAERQSIGRLVGLRR